MQPFLLYTSSMKWGKVLDDTPIGLIVRQVHFSYFNVLKNEFM